MEKDNMSIDEVDSILGLNTTTTNLPAYIAWLSTIAIYAIGAVGLMETLRANVELINSILPALSGFISETYPILITFGLLVVLVSVIGSILLLYLVRVAAKIALYFILLLIPLSTIILGAFLLAIGSVMGVISLGIGLVFLLLFYIFRRRLELAARAMQLSAQAVLDEKGSILAVIISGLFGMITFVFLAFASIYVGNTVYSIYQDQNYSLIASGVVFFLGSWSVSFVSYLMYGTVVGIVHDWYRSPQVDVASFGKGLRRALKVQGGIALYALLMVTLRFIVEYLRGRARRSRAITDLVASALAGVISGIIQFITIYAVPAMVIRRAGFRDGVKDSWSKLKDLFIETLAANFGFGYVMGIFTLLMMAFYGGMGYFLGYFVLHPIITTVYAANPSFVGLVSAIGFISIGLIPTALIFDTLRIAFTTILYEFGLDIEFSRRGISLPKRLPRDIEESFRELLAEKGIVF